MKPSIVLLTVSWALTLMPQASFGQNPDVPAPPAEGEPEAPPAPQAGEPATAATGAAGVGARDEDDRGRWAVSPSGGTGLLRTGAAQTVLPGMLRIAVGADFFLLDGLLRDGDNASRVRGKLSLSGSPVDYMELWFNVAFASTSNDFTEPSLLQAVGDLGFGIKGFYPVIDALSLGADFELRLITGVGGSGYDAVQAAPRFLLTADFLQLESKVPLRLHLNLGYLYDGTKDLVATTNDAGETFTLTTAEQFGLGFSEFDRFTAGFSIEVPVKYVSPYLEYTIQVPLDYLATPGVVVEPTGPVPGQAAADQEAARGALARVMPQRLTPGIRVTALEDITFDVAVEIGLTPDTARGVPVVPPYNVVFLASYNLDPFGVKKPKGGPAVAVPVLVPTGGIAGGGRLEGTVVDRDTGTPIEGAIVRFDRSTPVATDEDGTFRSQPLEGGPIRMVVSAQGYEDGEAQLDLPPEETSEVEVALAPTGSQLRGVVEGPAGPIPGATVQLFGAVERSVRTGDDGAFQVSAPPGQLRLVARAKGLMSNGTVLTVEPGKTQQVAIRLAPASDEPLAPEDGRIALERPLTFQAGSSELPEDAPVLLSRLVDLLLSRPDLRVRVAGHTDNQGDPSDLQTLSDNRATAVLDALVARGVPAGQLEADGFGADKPIAPNSTGRGRAQNNRVEFEVLE